MNNNCAINIAIDPFAVLTFFTFLVYLFVEDERYKVRVRKLLEIREMILKLTTFNPKDGEK